MTPEDRRTLVRYLLGAGAVALALVVWWALAMSYRWSLPTANSIKNGQSVRSTSGPDTLAGVS